MARLRSYARINARSQKVKDGAEAFQAVYAEVDARSEGRCEVTMDAEFTNCWDASKPARRVERLRCPRRAVEHHHLFKPRRAHHTANEVVGVCRVCHDRMEYPYPRGRLSFVGRLGPAFLFALRYAASKFQAGGQGE